MDLLPQELIDKIINNLPRYSLLPCSLVSKRWRRRSQQRAFQEIKFFSEYGVNRWCTDVPQDSDGPSSYVQLVVFHNITSWHNPAILGRTLKSLGSLTNLWVSGTGIPDELPAQISRGEFGKGITSLSIWYPPCTLAIIMSTILSLPNLKTLCVEADRIEPEEPLSTYPAPSQKGPLDLLQLRGDVSGLGEALAKSRFVSRRLALGIRTQGIEQLIMHSSETVVELNLYDITMQDPAWEVIPPSVHLPSLPALTTLNIDLCMGNPSPRLINILRYIPPTPTLTSITIGYDKWSRVRYPFGRGRWIDVDRWLAQMAGHSRVQEGLPVILTWLPKDKPVQEGFLHEFRRAGGKIKTESAVIADHDNGWHLSRPGPFC